MLSHNSLLFKGTVSPDIGLHLSFWKIKLVLSAGQFMVLKFLLLRSSWDIQKLIIKLLLWKHLLIVQTLRKAVPESLFRLTDFAEEHQRVYSVSRLCTVNQVSESPFVSLLAGFSKPDMTVNIRSSSSAAYQNWNPV